MGERGAEHGLDRLLNDDKMPRLGIGHCGNGYIPVQAHKTPIPVYGQCQKIGVGKVPSRNEPRPIQSARRHHADIVGPELMGAVATSFRQPDGNLLRRRSIGVTRLRKNPHAAVLGDGTGGPPPIEMLLQPVRCRAMMNMMCIEQRNQHIDVEQRPHD